MPEFTSKKGSSLTDLKVRLIDRDETGLDLTDVSSVLFYLRKEGATTNLVDGLPCSIIPPVGAETYPQRVQGPDATLSDTGDFRAYFKAVYGPNVERIPSSGYLYVRVEENFEI